MSSLTRAFTRRNKRPEVSAPMPYREGQVKFSSGTIKRGKISAPIQLISTTNMLALNAPELHSATSSTSSASSMKFRDDSDVSNSPHSFASPVTSPGASSHEASPIEPHSLPSFPPKRSPTVTSEVSSTTTPSLADAPIIPKRALSHTKRSHQELVRNRSLKAMAPPPLSSVRSSPSMRTIQDFGDANAHPFGKELEQVREVAEEFGNGHMLDEEELILEQKGLQKFSVDEYIIEIQDLYDSIFDDHIGPIPVTSWV